MSTAYFRACHRSVDPEPWVLDDPIAAELLPVKVIAQLDAVTAEWPVQVRAMYRAQSPARSRLADDIAIRGLAEDRSDYVNLGAGLDTFAWRHLRASEFTVWEIDHPDSQKWKRQRLASIGRREPENVRFLPVDLSTTALESLDLPLRATWSWLGVTVYLEKDATASTLKSIASKSESAVLVVEFSLLPEYCDDLGRMWRKHTAESAGSVGERHISLYSPAEAQAMVTTAGFEIVEVVDARELRTRYLGNQPALLFPGATLYVVARTG